MLLSAPMQDEAFGHVGISPNRGSQLSLRVGEDVSAERIQAAFSSTASALVGDKKSVCAALRIKEGFKPLLLAVESLRLCRKIISL